MTSGFVHVVPWADLLHLTRHFLDTGEIKSLKLKIVPKMLREEMTGQLNKDSQKEKKNIKACY